MTTYEQHTLQSRKGPTGAGVRANLTGATSSPSRPKQGKNRGGRPGALYLIQRWLVDQDSGIVAAGDLISLDSRLGSLLMTCTHRKTL
ncbi:hypothetical protein NL676_007234 [Syzygium grande]|nr:hypothetical protein NL676_007234 [Syzygium grande]